MGKLKVGNLRQTILVEGDANLVGNNEILIEKSEGYTILRKRDSNGKLKTSIVVPLEEFKRE